MKWFLPSFNGDFRLENIPVLGDAYRAVPGGPAADTAGVQLLVTAPTPYEREMLNGFLATAVRNKWTAISTLPEGDSTIVLAATMADAGSELVKATKPMDRSITAVTFEGGKLKVVDASESKALVEAVEREEKKKKPGALSRAAATVARATPSCPQCVPGSVKMASEVLLTFLTPKQHADWARNRAFIVVGGTTGRRYLLAHRHSKAAQRFGRICYGIDDGMVIHFHDNSVPPEEEVLGAKLILEHRESYLRNEATMFHVFDEHYEQMEVLKNPFGDRMDGTVDAGFMNGFGLGRALPAEDKKVLREFFLALE